MLKWEDVDTAYVSIYKIAKLGELNRGIIFSIVYDGMSSKEELNRLKLLGNLPGIKRDLGRYSNVIDAMIHAEKIFTYWLNRAHLIYKLKEKEQCQ